MKKVTLAALVAALALTLLWAAPTAQAAPSAAQLGKRIAKLERKVNRLQRRLRTVTCGLRIMPLTQYDGYWYDDGYGTPYLETALDVTPNGLIVDAWSLVYPAGFCGAPSRASADTPFPILRPGSPKDRQ